MDVSVVVSTHNRARRLPAFFDALAALRVPHTMSWEVLIVDNASTDDTADVLSQEIRRGRLPVVGMREPVPGKSRGVNLAIQHAAGSLLVFTDDDVEPSDRWLEGYWEAAEEYPEVDGFAGKLLPRWDGPVPGWLALHGDIGVVASLTHTRDLGDDVCPMAREVAPGGANAALRREAVERMGLWRTDLGPGTGNPCAEDTEYMRRLFRTGGRFLYVPRALAFHRNEVGRFTKEEALRWAEQSARCDVLARGRGEDGELRPSTLWGVPRYLWRQAAGRFVAWVLEPRAERRFRKKVMWLQTLGSIRGHSSLREGLVHVRP